jgi:hypothetical protein
MSSQAKPTGKRLNESQRLEIISKLRKNCPPSKRALAREYSISEAAIRKLWVNRESILERSALMSEEAKEKTFRASVGRFTELEDALYTWIDRRRRAKLPVPPSLAISKAKNIASTLSIPESNFKASWQWFYRFKERHGLQKMLLHGEGAEVDKNDPGCGRDLLCHLHNKMKHHNAEAIIEQLHPEDSISDDPRENEDALPKEHEDALRGHHDLYGPELVEDSQKRRYGDAEEKDEEKKMRKYPI